MSKTLHDRSSTRPFGAFCVLALSLGLQPWREAAAFETFVQNTDLLEVSLGSARSDQASDLRRGGYELADGSPISFDDWYRPRVKELNVLFLSEVAPNFGLIWGLSSGERGDKYRINPGLRVGFIVQRAVGDSATVSLQVATMLGGRLQEKPCQADFGPIAGGEVAVNCRLAATTLPPEETLNYLVRMSGADEARITLRYDLSF
nr:hypothetical protein [Paracoccus saliphilus]